MSNTETELTQEQQDQMDLETTFVFAFNEMARTVHSDMVKNGFWENKELPGKERVLSAIEDVKGVLTQREQNIILDSINQNWPKQERNAGESHMLMVTEIAESFEGVRNHNAMSDKIPQFTAQEEELADAIIRKMDWGSGMGLRIAEALICKIRYNRSRPYKHGKVC